MVKQKNPSPPPTQEAREHVLVKARAAAGPIDARTLAKQLEPPFQLAVKDLTPVLDDFVGDGTLFRYPGKTAKGAARYWDRDLTAIARKAALAALERVDLPITAKDLALQMNGPFKFVEKELTPILEEAASHGQLHRFAPKSAKGKARYWGHDLLEYGRRSALRTLQSKGPLAAAKLQTFLKEVDKIQFDQVLRTLREAGSIFPHPPVKSGPELFGVRPPVPEVYLKIVLTELTKTVKKLRDASVPLEALRRAIVQIVEAAGISFSASATGAKDVETKSVDFMSLMRQLESGASRGALVGARDLRRAAGLPKATFDEAVFDLARAGQVSLHKHDYPASLTESERDELITDGHGHYYIGVALRQSGDRPSPALSTGTACEPLSQHDRRQSLGLE